jgi:selenocysteine lyase/cysteine desulfurase
MNVKHCSSGPGLVHFSGHKVFGPTGTWTGAALEYLEGFGMEAAVRPTFVPYNMFAEIDALADAVRRIAANLGG